jgi:hypothetical protein
MRPFPRGWRFLLLAILPLAHACTLHPASTRPAPQEEKPPAAAQVHAAPAQEKPAPVPMPAADSPKLQASILALASCSARQPKELAATL